ncbi:N-acetyltransferase [Deinococcus ruber]|uniref:GCN5 family acetyltransferase n=1 Tax=Deinococcus ruber TaxID=1848197 RepID=A0A918F2J9_9DEIO|nr:N-acetyltransferase [Deinococcus ruber]GGQ95206.1 GCN5 family acetyltransferase [Deinococcus ruber]
MPSLLLRSFDAADYALLAEFLTRLHPDSPQSAEDLMRFDAGRLPDEHHARTLAVLGGELIGMVETERSRQFNQPGWYGLHVRTADAGLWQQLEKSGLDTLRPLSPAVLHTSVREGWPEYQRLQNEGWQEHERTWLSTLDLTHFDAASFAARAQRAQAAGIVIGTPEELGWDGSEAVQRRLYELVVLLLSDVPTTDPLIPWPFEVWQRRIIHENFRPSGPLIAVHSGEWVGLTELYQPMLPRPGTLRQGLTGVRREWRGNGVAWALKLKAAARAQAQGWRQILTSNHVNNREMLGINEAMGFVKEPALVVLKREWNG